ncbi:hypothetical protein FDECE_6314 [Fusarium decemcellulare]|nr:hypothetical protein FDECE_6314 [Fusarium decemcellulare]
MASPLKPFNNDLIHKHPFPYQWDNIIFLPSNDACKLWQHADLMGKAVRQMRETHWSQAGLPPFSDIWFSFGNLLDSIDLGYYQARLNEASSIYEEERTQRFEAMKGIGPKIFMASLPASLRTAPTRSMHLT